MAKSQKTVSAPGGHISGDDHNAIAPKARTHKAAGGHVSVDSQDLGAAAPPPTSPKAAGGQRKRATHEGVAAGPPPSLPETIALIRSAHRKRQFAMEQRKRLMNALGAFLRTALGWTLELPDSERKRIAEKAETLVDIGRSCAKGKRPDIVDAEYSAWEQVIQAALAGCIPWDALESDNTKRMEALSVTLPVWERWAKDVRGFGARSLATLVAEIGDLDNYATVARVWKRMGVGVLDGVRQGGLSKSASKEQWIEHGYKARRRALLFVVGDCLVKSNGDGYYRAVYLGRKQYEIAKAMERGLLVAPAARIPKTKREQYVSDGVIHKRAQRYMEKRLLKHLWQAWRAQKPDNDMTVAA